MAEIALPFEVSVDGIPPSVNNQGAVYVAKRHKIWNAAAQVIQMRPAGWQDPKQGGVTVRVMYFHDSRDRHPKDVDNILKAILDALDGTDNGRAGGKPPHAISDDKNVEEVTSRRTRLNFALPLNGFRFNAEQLRAVALAANSGAALYIKVEGAPNHQTGL